jgi:poly(3-hydroxybutyrate) depolymerase
MGRCKVLLIPVLLATAALAAGSAPEVNSRSARCENSRQPYLYYSPDRKVRSEKDHLLPTVMLLHGAGDGPANMMNAWKRFAAQQKIILLAPDLPRVESYEASAPAIFRCVVEDARQFVHIDLQRVYLFGNSMGGYLAYDGAMLESEYFAAVAVHAMCIADDYTWIVDRAQRKTPVAIYIGDRDQFFSVDKVRKTRDLLRKSGFPVHYVEMENHDHNYYARAGEINADAWDFLKGKSLRLPAN